MCRQEADLDESLSNTEGQERDETLKEKRKLKKKRKRKKSPIPDFVENMDGIESDVQSVQEKPAPLACSVDRSLLITEDVRTVEECGTSISNSSFRTQAEDTDFQSEFLSAETDQSIRKKKKVKRNPRKGSLDADQENPISSSLQSSYTKTPTGLTEDHISKPPEEAPEDETFVEKKALSASSVPLAKEKRHKRKQKLDNGLLPEYSTTAELLDKTSQSTTTEGEVDCVSGKCLKSILPAEADVCSKMGHILLSDNNCRKTTNDKTILSLLQAENTDLVIQENIDRNNQSNIIPCTLEAEKHNHMKKKDKKDQISSVDKNLGSSEDYPSTRSLHSSESTMNDGALRQVPDELCISKMIHDVADDENLEDHGKQNSNLSLVNDDSYLENTSTTHKENNMLENLVDLHVARPLSSHPRKKLLVLDLNRLLVDVIDISRGHRPQRKADKQIGRRLVFKRPFCDEFLKFCFRRFDVGIWSSLMMQNLQPVVEFLLGDMRSKLLFCWDGSFCTRTGLYTIENRMKPLVLKELKKIWEKDWRKVQYTPSCTLLVDDSPYKALSNPAYTGIFPRPFMLHHEDDNALGLGGKIRVYLEGLTKADDVREYVKSNPFGQQAIATDHPDWDFYKQVLVSRVEDDSQR